MSRPTFKLKIGPTGQGTYELISKDGQVFDISNMVNACVIKVDVASVNTVVMRLIGVELDLDLEGNLEVGESK